MYISCQGRRQNMPVGRNGSRYVDPDEFFSRPGIQKIVEGLKDFQPDEGFPV